MAKLYAELASDKGGRIVGKGGNLYTTTVYKRGNIPIFETAFDGNQIQVRIISKHPAIEKEYTFWCSNTHELQS